MKSAKHWSTKRFQTDFILPLMTSSCEYWPTRQSVPGLSENVKFSLSCFTKSLTKVIKVDSFGQKNSSDVKWFLLEIQGNFCVVNNRDQQETLVSEQFYRVSLFQFRNRKQETPLFICCLGNKETGNKSFVMCFGNTETRNTLFGFLFRKQRNKKHFFQPVFPKQGNKKQ